jgi:phage terminase small subunit
MKAKSAALQPPKHLRPDTAAWFAGIVAEYELDSHHLRLLTKACEAWDRSEQAREAVAKLGMTYEDRFGAPRARPEIAIERDSRLAFARLVRELGLDVAPPAESRPNALRANR